MGITQSCNTINANDNLAILWGGLQYSVDEVDAKRGNDFFIALIKKRMILIDLIGCDTEFPSKKTKQGGGCVQNSTQFTNVCNDTNGVCVECVECGVLKIVVVPFGYEGRTPTARHTHY